VVNHPGVYETPAVCMLQSTAGVASGTKNQNADTNNKIVDEKNKNPIKNSHNNFLSFFSFNLQF
jgi:hypothetical protein